MEGSVGVVLALDLDLSDEVLEAQRQALKAACTSTPTKAQLAQLRIAADAELQAMEDSLTNTVLALDFDISDEALKAQQEELRAACAPTPTKAPLTNLRDVASAELDDMEAKTGAPALQLDLSDSDVQRLQRELAAACSVSTDTIQASVSSPALSAAPLPALPSTSKTTQAKSATRAKPRATSKSSSVQKENRPLTSAAASRKTSGSKGLKAQNVKARSARGENAAEPQVSSRKGAGGGLPRRPLSALPLANCR
ncbi:hypothetical protein C8Q80DRAFT_1194264 [Daedaleopsis nitida]|nr:hypothetical protein C8Q80DRAFT_1194264 [Daedaleopsis nitida]